jgi:hypothetical protein
MTKLEINPINSLEKYINLHHVSQELIGYYLCSADVSSLSQDDKNEIVSLMKDCWASFNQCRDICCKHLKKFGITSDQCHGADLCANIPLRPTTVKEFRTYIELYCSCRYSIVHYLNIMNEKEMLSIMPQDIKNKMIELTEEVALKCSACYENTCRILNDCGTDCIADCCGDVDFGGQDKKCSTAPCGTVKAGCKDNKCK